VGNHDVCIGTWENRHASGEAINKEKKQGDGKA